MNINNLLKEQIPEKNFLKQASNNRVLYYYLKNINKKGAKKILRNGEKRINKLKKTLVFINKIFKKNKLKFLVVKTYKFISYVTFDVDLLVKPKDFEKTKQVLRKNGCKIEKHPGKQTFKQANCRKKGFLNIDLHTGFSWQGVTYLDDKLLWKNPQKVRMQGVLTNIPNATVEFLLNAAHVLSERRFITILDYLFFVQSLKKTNLKLMLSQTKKHYWDTSFKRLLRIIKQLSYNSKFPYFLPTSFVINIFWERFRKTGYFPKFDFAYYFFTMLRYYLSGKKRMPFYRDWYKKGRR